MARLRPKMPPLGGSCERTALPLSITITTDIPVYFCDLASLWQRGSNQNTNGLLRQYFPKSTDLSVHTREHLAAFRRTQWPPTQALGWQTPAERLHNNARGLSPAMC